MSEYNQSYDAEVALLSIIIKNSDRVFSIRYVKSHMFSSNPHRILFDVISDLLSKNLVPDYGLLVSNLKSRGILDQVGGEEYLKFLANQSYDPQNLEEFERIVINSFKATAVIKVSKQSYDTLLSVPSEVDNVTATMRETLDKLDSSSNVDNTESISDCIDAELIELKKRLDLPGVNGKSTGLKTLDLVTNGFSPGDLWVLAGRPSSGKTAVMCNMALSGKNKSLIFSLEMRKQTLMERFIAIKTGVSLSDIRLGMIDKKNLDKIIDSINDIKSAPIFVDSNFSANIDYIVSVIRKYKRLYDIDIVFIDYIGLLVKDVVNETQEIGKITRRLKLLANDLGIAIVILSQLNRKVEERDDKRPILSDLRQSGDLEQDPDVVIMFYRDEYYNKDTKDKNQIEFLIRKQRNGEVGVLFYRFFPNTNKVEESAHGK